MKSILLVFLSSFLLTVNSHPRNSDIIPKDYYKRQILQPIPGYIPVYIKADGVPIIRSEKVKHESNKVPGESHSSKKHFEPKSKNAEPDQMNTEIHIKEVPQVSGEHQSEINSSKGKEKFTLTEGKKFKNEEKNH